MGGLRVAVLGVGRWGGNIARHLATMGVLVVGVDPDDSARRRAVSLGAGVVRVDVDLDSVDGIVVATPASTHAEILLGLAGFAGPIACEKPLTVSVDDAIGVLEAVGDRLTAFHEWRYHPAVELLGQIACSGDIGDPTLLRTVRTNWTSLRTDLGPIWTLLPTICRSLRSCPG